MELAVKGWSSVEGPITVSVGSQQQEVIYKAKMADRFEVVTLTFTSVPANPLLTIKSPSGKRCFIDYVVMYKGESQTTIPGDANGDKTVDTQDVLAVYEFMTSHDEAADITPFDINADAKTILAWDENEEEVAGWTADAPCIKVPLGTTTSGYQNLYYTANAWDDDHSDYVPGWADADGFLVTDAQISMLNGYGVWFVAGASNLTVTIKGEVKSGASDTITGDVGWNMLKLPYPVSINALSSKINWNVTGKGVAAWDENEDEIEGWTADAITIKIPLGTTKDGYQNIYYSSNAWDDDKGDYVEGWADADGFLVTDAVIPEGQAFWFVLPSAPVTSTVTK